ncbi:ribosomal protein S12 methylthiotransferase accessory factor YcaO [Nocardioides thalensis]|uniref:Ribosomal protein S12 methylthiotransferase accessory factor YcaO n=1 Tax=Nocardioides thalensis TaxID=1914755 RepID=A0A853C4T3_9ACTN|nr:hypothetical protein [Nocardioides thalensis]NYJ02247.1 ribosomal protein S12 methylthiotransferase accessory factor YcaO [Nocardioides thalensis]
MGDDDAGIDATLAAIGTALDREHNYVEWVPAGAADRVVLLHQLAETAAAAGGFEVRFDDIDLPDGRTVVWVLVDSATWL